MNILKKNSKLIIGIVIGIALTAGVVAYASYRYFANDIKYTENKNVGQALNELYGITQVDDDVESLKTRVTALENSQNSNSIGTYYIENFSNVSCTKNTGNLLKSITLPAGKYVITGYACYQGGDLRYYISLGDANSSAYDKNGWVAMNITDIVTTTQQKTYNFYLFPSDKDVVINNGFIKAIKIAD